MDLPSNPFLKAIRSGQPQIGLWLSLANPYAAEIVAGSGYDWVLIDMEHAPNDLSSVLAQLQVFAAYSTTPLVRPDWNDPVKVKRLLDAGAPGLLFPMIANRTEAEAAVAAMRYPPRGQRGVSGSTRANNFGRIKDYFARIEDETALLIQAETISALDQIEHLADVDGVDGVFFGPADIGADLGYLGQPMHEAVWDVIRPAAQRLIRQGTPVGTIVMDPDFASRLIDEGFTFVACGSDANLLARGSDALLNKMRGT
ncbi:HpcH/HpaI aldolase/citrate lyase family protein [Thalassococcus sp. S3]|uniref:HpcH/HpaI aldolase family protein n=1 Tax=Thalassococcus sp. S3 TaxID=2017482 RepID=UPI00102419F0|nr:HpcH/HpaI aldolase/citrate lyase family protein [Thalassococcus sp. S3]QBF33668.1 4-hydroxy-2-oxo-heptane-1,7-dioate aldolase [Thalassococcus sp. S3]